MSRSDARLEGEAVAFRDRVRALLAGVAYCGWTFAVGGNMHESWLQLRWTAFNTDGGIEPEEQRGRKWRLSRHMTDGELVQTAFKAVMTAEEHEVRERFRFNGVAIFGPHISLAALVAAAQRKEVRP